LPAPSSFIFLKSAIVIFLRLPKEDLLQSYPFVVVVLSDLPPKLFYSSIIDMLPTFCLKKGTSF